MIYLNVLLHTIESPEASCIRQISPTDINFVPTILMLSHIFSICQTTPSIYRDISLSSTTVKMVKSPMLKSSIPLYRAVQSFNRILKKTSKSQLYDVLSWFNVKCFLSDVNNVNYNRINTLLLSSNVILQAEWVEGGGQYLLGWPGLAATERKIRKIASVFLHHLIPKGLWS